MSLTDLVARAAAWNASADPTAVAEARGAVLSRRFGIHYRRILDARSGDAVGYCAGARSISAPARGSLPWR